MIIEEAVKQFKEGKIQNSLDVDGYKEILGMWIDKSESSSFLEQRIWRFKRTWSWRHLIYV